MGKMAVKKFEKKHANKDEKVIQWAEGYIEGKGLGAIGHGGNLIVTDSRVIFYRDGVFGETLETIPLKNITSIERKSFMGTRRVIIHTSHDQLEFKSYFNKNEEAELLEAIESGRYDNTEMPPTEPASQESNLDKLKKLAELKEMGALSEEEFNESKQKLLADI